MGDQDVTVPKRCIVNVSIGGWYPKGLDRLQASIKKYSPEIDVIGWRDEYPPGCPPHQKIPYAFKPYAFKHARGRGYRSAIWLDSAAWAVRDVTPVFEGIERDGCYLQNGGHNTGQWCSDAALVTLGVTRDEAMKMGHLTACIMGLDFTNETTCKFLDQWLAYADDGITFPGAWTNKNGEVSKDPRVKGHRHDQTAASVLSLRLGMPWHVKKVRLQYKLPKNLEPRNDFICFMSAGM